MQRLHDVLSKLSRKGKSGGLGIGGGTMSMKPRDPSLPNNPLYARFVREGAGHKRTFDNDGEENDEVMESKAKHRRTKDTYEDNTDLLAVQQLLPELIKSTLRDHGKKQSKEIWKLICSQLDAQGKDGKGFKKQYKKAVNALVDTDEVIVGEDGSVEIVMPIKNNCSLSSAKGSKKKKSEHKVLKVADRKERKKSEKDKKDKR